MRLPGFPLISSLCLFWLVGCAANPSLTPGEYRISGELRSVGGAAPRDALVILTRLEDRASRPLVKAPVASDGHFSLVAPGPGDYSLWLTAPGHPGQQLYLQMVADKPALSLQATLATHDYLGNIDVPSVVGSWNGFNPYMAEFMLAQPDGTWVFERAVEGDSVSYYLLGLTRDGRGVPGPQAEGYELADSGDYRSRVSVREGRIRIVFDPRAQPRATAPFHVAFAPPYASLDRINALHARASSLSTLAWHELLNGRSKRDQRSGYGTLPQELLDFARGSHPFLVMRQMAALDVLELPGYDFPTHRPGGRGEALAAELLQLLPANNPHWAMAPSGLKTLASLANPSTVESFLMDAAEHNPEETVQALALSALLEKASKEKDTQRVASLVDRLKPYTEKHMVARATIESVSPSKPRDEQAPHVVKGQLAPAFSAELLEGQGVVSRESLLGRFYLIDFWATWCKPCVGELGPLHAAAEKFNGRGGFTVLSVSLDQDEEQVRRFRSGKWKMPWMHVFAGFDFQAPLPAAFQLNGIPFAVLVDARGNVVATQSQLRGEELEKTLDALLPARAP
jgi:thiol-disulfide isomerase/thioredoxin